MKVGAVLNQLFVPSGGVGVLVSVETGAVASRLTVTETGPVEPSRFDAEHERVNVPSVVNVSSTQPVFVVAAPPSLTCHARPTSPVYQPLEPVGRRGRARR